MNLSVKDKILLAIYIEYQKDVPDMKTAITWDNIKVNHQEFLIGLDKLENEKLINDARYAKGGRDTLVAFLDKVKPSVYGLRYVEDKLLQDQSDISDEENDPKTGNTKKVIRNAVAFGWNEIKDIAAKTLAEMSKQ